MPLRGEVSRTSGVRDPHLYLLNSMNKTLSVCVYLCLYGEVMRISTDSNVKCFV